MFFFSWGFGLGSVDGYLAIQYIDPYRSKDNFKLQCHNRISNNAINLLDIYAVCICKHQSLSTLLTIKILLGQWY